MGLRLKRVADEFRSFREACEDWWEEMVVQNGPRFRRPDQWVHLWIDIFGATFQLFGRLFDRLHYTLAHLVGVGIPVGLIYLAWEALHGQ